MATRTLLAALLMVASLYGAQGQDAACPLLPSDLAQVNWSTVRTACNASSTAAAATDAFCEACICSVGRAITTGLYQAGVQLNATQSTLDRLLDTCTATVGSELITKASLPANALSALAQCDAAATSKKCVAAIQQEQGTRATAAANATATAAKSAAAGRHDSIAAVAAVASLMLGAALLP